jgi:hypothetical protein
VIPGTQHMTVTNHPGISKECMVSELQRFPCLHIQTQEHFLDDVVEFLARVQHKWIAQTGYIQIAQVDGDGYTNKFKDERNVAMSIDRVMVRQWIGHRVLACADSAIEATDKVAQSLVAFSRQHGGGSSCLDELNCELDWTWLNGVNGLDGSTVYRFY